MAVIRKNGNGNSGGTNEQDSSDRLGKKGLKAKAAVSRVRNIQEKAKGLAESQYSGALADLGFVDVDDVMPSSPYLIISSEAEERCGKTHFAMTAPGPIAYLTTDPNYRYVLPKFPKGKIIPNLFEIPDNQDGAVKQWERFVKAYYTAQYSGKFRTGVVDTWTDIYRLIRMAEFGKTKQVSMYNYDIVNAPLFRMLDDITKPGSSMNWIFIHKVTDEYVKLKGQEKEVRTGRMIRAGWKHINYKTSVMIRHVRWDEGEDEDGNRKAGAAFGFQVLNCGPAPEITNKVFEGGEANFLDLAMAAYPDVDAENWIDEFGF